MENKPNLHEHLAWELILLRLPLKSLVRSKCVCKSWLSMISDVNFAKLHYNLNASSDTPQLVFSVSITDSNKAQIQSIDPEGSLEIHSINLVSPFQSSQEVQNISVLGVCRGFILLGHGPELNKPPENLLVWNPSTGIHRTLTYSEIGSTLRCLPCYASYIFEYDAFADDYFVVIAWIHGDSSSVERLELFSMRTNSSWTQFDAIHGFPCSKRWYEPLFSYFNGTLHCFAIDHDESVKAIIAFDLNERNFYEIPLPDDVAVCDWTLRLKVIGGCLYLFCFPRDSPGFVVLWMMKEHKVKSCWTKCNYVPQNATPPFVDPHDATTPLPRCFFSPIYFTKAGHVVGYSRVGLAKLGDKGELLHYRGVYKRCHVYIESLLSLPGQPLEDDNK